MTILTPELASAMLTVLQRRQRHDPATRYTVSVREAALWGEGDVTLPPRRAPTPKYRAMVKTRGRKPDSGWLR